MWKLGNMLFNNYWVKERIKKNIRKYLEMKMKTHVFETYGIHTQKQN